MAKGRNHVNPQAAEAANEQVESAAFRAPNLWVETQAKAFDQIDEVARRWLDRRRDDLDHARRSFEAMRDADNLSDLMRIQQDWVLGAMRRGTADIAEFGGMALNLTQRTTSQIVRVGEETADDMERAGLELRSVAGSKHPGG